MTTTIYRQYRPQQFRDVVGQTHVRTTLTAELESHKVAHAYLFVGPRGVGKTTVARLMAKAVNCTSRKGAEPDNRCDSCTAMNEGRSLDLLEIDAASHTQVDHVREHILPAARTAPASGQYKVFIIDEVHMLSASAFNALLKMLEEPPAHVLFILATTEPHRVPETIVSRCQRFDFHRVAVDDMVKRMSKIVTAEGLSVGPGVLERIARSAAGSLRDAESVLGQVIGLGERKLTEAQVDLVLPRTDVGAVLELVDCCLSRRTLDGLQLVQRLVDDGVPMAVFMRQSVELLRSLLLAKVGVSDSIRHLERGQQATAQQLLSRATVQELQRLLEVLLRRERDERQATIAQLPLELAVVELTAAAEPSEARSAASDAHPRSTAERTAPKRSPTAAAARRHIDIVEDWPAVLTAVAKTNPSVAALLKTATPRGIVNGRVELSFAYAFHRERVLEPRNRAIIESALSAVVGMAVNVDASVDSTAARQSPGAAPDSRPGLTDQVWDQALRSFGGSAMGNQEAP
ncbi:MAG: DNA polymerase III subunit gamma/tau [Candidatus Kerfeldbacteria bacterium]|nr:DNA polymerase III subunit gamma/tau [Candidatus Kerfeldbacteria bacterium]